MMVLSELEQDALTEIFNIGVGLAADVLSQMVNEPVRLSVPVVILTSQRHASEHFQSRENRPLCAVRQTYRGEVTTEAILMFPEENSLELVRLMVGGDLPLEELTEMEQDAMIEIGNIILNAIISSLSSILRLTFEGSLPTLKVGTSDTIFVLNGTPSASVDEIHDAIVLMLTIDFELSDRQVNGYLAFLLDVQSSETLISQLGQFIRGDIV